MRPWGEHPLGVASLAAIACCCALATTATGKAFEANRTGDPPPGKCTKKHCTLREAVAAANDREGRDVVRLAPGKRYELAIPPEPGDGSANAGGDLDSNDPLRVETRKGKRAIIDANQVDALIEASGAPLTLSRLILTGGSDVDCSGVTASFGRLVVRRSTVRGNVSGGNGGGICSFQGPTTISDSLVVGNQSGNAGGGAQIYGPLRVSGSTFRGNESDIGGGLAYVGADRAVVTGSTFVQNTAVSAGGLAATSFSVNDCKLLRLERSSVVGNTAEFGAGGVLPGCLNNTVDASTIAGNEAQNGGGAQIVQPTTISNSTIAGNEATFSGGGISGGNTDMALRSVTIARNSAGSTGGGLAFTGGAFEGLVRNTLIALNSAAAAGEDCSGSLSSQGGNLLGTDAGCTGFGEPSDRVDPQPKLGGLKRNGGPTATMALRKGSPAINAGVKPAPKRDQRGVKRRGRPDAGAYERTRKH